MGRLVMGHFVCGSKESEEERKTERKEERGKGRMTSVCVCVVWSGVWLEPE